MIRALYLTLCLFIAGCGTTYTVSVNSLAADIPLPPESTCFLESAMPGVNERDLLFREVAHMLEPALAFQGLTVTDDLSTASIVVRIAYAEGSPIVTWETESMTVQKPVYIRANNKTKVEYVSVEEQRLVSRTSYNASLLVDAYLKEPNNLPGDPLWKTAVTCSGPENDLQTLLKTMAPVLSNTLGARNSRVRNFEVYVEDNGAVTVDEVLPGRWW